MGFDCFCESRQKGMQQQAKFLSILFFLSFFGRKGKKGSNASNGSDKQKRINQLLNASHNSQAEKDYLRSRILEIFEEDEKAIQKGNLSEGVAGKTVRR